MIPELTFNVTNIVATTSTGEKLDLDLIKKNFPNTQYKPKSYDGLVYKISEPKVTILLNWSGKLIIVGGTSTENTIKARDLFYQKIRELGYFPEVNNIVIKNIVLSINVGESLDLGKIFEANLNSNLEYELEIFPGLIFRNKKPKFGAVLFKSGKIMVAGLKDMGEIPFALESIQNLIKFS